MGNAHQDSAPERPAAAPWIVRLLRWLRPAEGWLILILAWVAVCCLPAAAIEGGLIPGLEPTLWLATLGLLVGRWLAHPSGLGGKGGGADERTLSSPRIGGQGGGADERTPSPPRIGGQGGRVDESSRVRLPALVAAPVALLAGVLADLIWGVHVLRFGPLFAQSGRWLAWWFRCGASEKCLIPAPAFTYPADQGALLANFGQRVGWWMAGVFGGQGVADNLVLVAFVALLGWLVAAWAGWWLAQPIVDCGLRNADWSRRPSEPFVALLPTGALLAQQTYWAGKGYTWLLVFLAAVTLLLALAHYHRLTQVWEATGADYSTELRLGVGAAGLAIAGLALFLAPTLPFLTSRQVQEAFWRIFEQPYRRVEERLGQSFAGVQGGRSLVPPAGVAVGGLPRAHLLGGRPELGQEIALRVRVRGARPDDLLYWRGQTFAYYTGHGWQEDPEATSAERFSMGCRVCDFGAGEPWAVEQPLQGAARPLQGAARPLQGAARPLQGASRPLQGASRPAGRHPVLSSVEVVAASRAVLYAAGEPISADRPYQAVLRGPGELVALQAPDRPSRYTVLGAVADQDPDALRAAGTDYPPEVIALYLQLPADLPKSQIPNPKPEIPNSTPYDTALAIEAALRQIPYSLDVPPPPADREVVSWFLLDLRRGYCDYFATAMVVLARLNGIPARLAVGYAQGDYDPRLDRYEVTELQAHSWPELYFPGYGWIPFEPTPAQPAPHSSQLGGTARTGTQPAQPEQPHLAGPETLDAGLDELRALADEQAATAERLTWLRRTLAGLNCLLACWLASRLLRLNRPAARVGAAGEFVRLTRWGTRLGRPPRPADTPREYALAVVEAAERVAARGWPAGTRKAALVVGNEAPRLAQAFEQACYGPEPTDRPLREKEGQRWQPLWSALCRLWLSRYMIM